MATSLPTAFEQLLGQSVQRGQYQNPLFQATTRQAFAGLPAYARDGLSLDASLPPVDFSGYGGGSGTGTNLIGATGVGLAAAPALVKALKAIFADKYAWDSKAFSNATTDGSAAEPYSKVPGLGAGPGAGAGGAQTGGMGDFGNTSFDSNASTFNDPAQWDYILRVLFGMDPGSGGANATGGSGGGTRGPGTGHVPLPR